MIDTNVMIFMPKVQPLDTPPSKVVWYDYPMIFPNGYYSELSQDEIDILFYLYGDRINIRRVRGDDYEISLNNSKSKVA